MKYRMVGLGVLVAGILLLLPVCASARLAPEFDDVSYLEAYLLDSVSGGMLAAYGPLPWDEQMWLLNDVPIDAEMELIVVAFNAQERPVLEGGMTGIWLDPFYSDLGMGLIFLGVDYEGIRVISDPPFTDYGQLVLFPVDPVIPVAIDIKPGDDSNVVNLNARGRLPVAIRGTEAFDVTRIDAATLEVAGIPATKVSFEDVTGPEGVADGITDLVVFVDVEELSNALPDVTDGESVSLLLDGMLRDETWIEGLDTLVARKRPRPTRWRRQP